MQKVADRATDYYKSVIACQGADWFFKRISSLTVSKTTAKIPIKMPEALSANPASAQLFRSCHTTCTHEMSDNLQKKTEGK